jgi:nucleoside phosphorylase
VIDPSISLTLRSVLDSLRGGIRRDRAAGELLANASWWLDCTVGTAVTASSWAFDDDDAALINGRLTEAPYLAAIGFLVAIDIIPVSESLATGCAKVMQRAARTVERTGYADDPLVLAGLWLLAKKIDHAAEPKLRKAAQLVAAADDLSPVIAAILSLIDETVSLKIRPFVTHDAVELAVAICVAAANPAICARLFPQVALDEAGSKLMAAACSGAATPADGLETSITAIALSRAIGAASGGKPVARAYRGETVDVAFVVALREEFRHLHPSLQECTAIEIGDRQYYRGRIGRDGAHSAVATFIGDMGPVPAATVSSLLIEKWKPRHVVLVGIAGGVNKDVHLGDVVVATQVDSYLDSGKAVDSEGAFELLPSGAVFRADRKLVSLVRNLEFTQPNVFQEWQRKCRRAYESDQGLTASGPLAREPQLHDGLIASGPVVGASDAFRRWLLRRDRSYKAIEMEGAGVLWAAEQAWQPPRTLVVRGISDRADPNKAELDDGGRGAIRAWAMQNAVGFVWALLDAGMLV